MALAPCLDSIPSLNIRTAAFLGSRRFLFAAAEGFTLSLMLWRLDIKHRIRRRIGHGAEGDVVEVGGELGGDGFPGAADGGAGFAFGEGGVVELGGLHGIDDLAERDVVGGAGEEVSAVGAAAGVDDTGAAEVVEDLDQKVGGDSFALRKLVKAGKSLAVIGLGELRQGAAGVFQFLGNFHE